MIVFGIDPGNDGAIADLDTRFGEVSVIQMPLSFSEMRSALSKHGVNGVHVFIEKAQSMPLSKASAMFNYGVHFGQLLSAIEALRLPHTLVPPRIWSRVMHAGTKDAETKTRSIEACRRLFPSVDLLPGKRKKPHDGFAEACLIAEYGRRVLAGGRLASGDAEA